MAARVNRQKRLTGAHKVAILLRMLDPDVALEIMKHLSDRDIARIHRADSDVGKPAVDVLKEVATDFRDRLSSGGGGISAIQDRRIESMVRDAFDEQRLASIFGRNDVEVGRISDTLAEIDPKVVGRILTREYPQTAALVLSQLAPKEAAEVLLALPDELRIEVMMRVARLEKISEDMIAELNRSLQRELSGFEGAQSQEMVGVELAVQLFMHMDRAAERTLLEGIAERDAEVADQIREQMFTFEDLLGVSDKGVQLLLRNVENKTLVLALKGANEEMKQLFLRNVSKRVAEALVEDLESMGPVRLSEVEGAQQQIANQARQLSERGEIEVQGRGDDVLI
jgi:flagellar motor switch protein FliG